MQTKATFKDYPVWQKENNMSRGAVKAYKNQLSGHLFNMGTPATHCSLDLKTLSAEQDMRARMNVTVYARVNQSNYTHCRDTMKELSKSKRLTPICADVSAYQGLITETATSGGRENLIGSVNV